MQPRLLAFLADTESTIRAERPEPSSDSSWEMSRSVNYTLGIARLTLGTKSSSGERSSEGSILLQSYKLADGTICLRATVTWKDPSIETIHPIFAKPELRWSVEAELLASVWLAGPASKPAVALEEPALLAAG